MKESQVAGVTSSRAVGGAAQAWRARPSGSVGVFATAGVVFIVWQSVAWIPWLLDGPGSVMSPHPRAASWYTAMVMQTVAVIMATAVLTYVVRGCHRQHRLTLDAKICIGGLFTWWMDPLCNWIQPLFLFSSNWVNVRDWTGHVPFVVNPDAGRGIELPLFTLPMYTFGFLVNAMIIGILWRRLQHRWPELSKPALWIIGFGAGAVIEILMEVPVYFTHAWAFPGAPAFGSLAVGGQRFPWIEWFTGGVAFATIAAVRTFTDDRGHVLAERGLDRVAPRVRTVLSTLALVGMLNALWLGLNIGYGIVGLYSAPYPTMPAELLNGACDLPGTKGTVYGPCPGTPGVGVPLTLLPAGATRN